MECFIPRFSQFANLNSVPEAESQPNDTSGFSRALFAGRMTLIPRSQFNL
jgi:hypothetical protein